MGLDSALAGIDKVASQGIMLLGAQVCVIQDGSVLADHAFGVTGTGEVLQPDHLVAGYCALKPLLATTVATRFSEEELSRPLRCLSGGSRLSALDLLSHRAGLAAPQGAHYSLMSDHTRNTEILDIARESFPRAAYSEAVAWHVLGMECELLWNEPLGHAIAAEVLDALPLDELRICRSAPVNDDEVAVGASMRSGRGWVPLLWENTKETRNQWNPGFGGYCSARGLASFYAALLKGEFGAAQNRMIIPIRPRGTYDVVLGRKCGFGMGVMTGLADHSFGGALSATAYGHSGYQGILFAFADPTHNIAVAVTLLGGEDSDYLARILRPQFCNRLMADIES